MKKNLVAVVGRPNVGKSTFFNRVVGKRISIIEDTPGVTRDRIYAEADWAGHSFTLIDTGGLDYHDKSEMQQHITQQAEIATEIADVIIFLVNGRDGVVNADIDAASVLKKTKKPVIIAVNKLDNYEVDKIYEFYSLGFGEVFPISSLQSVGIGDLLDAVVSHFDKIDEAKEEDNSLLKIAVVGKPNAGKSSLVNRMIGEKRLVVSGVAGTTRDSIETKFKFNKKEYILVDTAGIRRKSAVKEQSIESYSIIRSLDAIRRADITLLVVDSEDGITDQDLKILSFINSNYKPCIILMNKWDLIEKDTNTMTKFNEQLSRDLAFMPYYKAMYISALTGQRVNEIINTVEEVYANATRRISTGTLNEIMHEAFSLASPASISGRRLKLLYATQAEITPPTFVLFVNNASLCQNSYLRYLENFIRKSVNFEGVPIKINLKNRGEEK